MINDDDDDCKMSIIKQQKNWMRVNNDDDFRHVCARNYH